MNAPLRVAMIILEYHPLVGGAQRQLARLAPRLQARGVAVTVLTRRYEGLPARELIDGVPVVRLPAPGPKPLAGPVFIAATLRALQRLRPDVVHAFSFFSPLLIALLAGRLWGVPVVDKLLRGGHLGDVARLQRKPAGPWRLAAYRRHVDTFITISAEIERELAALGVPAEKRAFIPNGVDLDRFTPVPEVEKAVLRRRLGLPAGPLVVYTGRLAPEKRLDLLVSAWPAAARGRPDAHLLLLGDGPEETRLRRLAGDGVLFGGRVDDVLPFLQAADIFVLPSATEGLSNALLEGMAVGLPCVATAVGGAPDLIVDGVSGRLVPPDRPERLANALAEFLGDPDRRTACGHRARAHIGRHYGLDTAADRHVALYAHLVTRRGEPLPAVLSETPTRARPES